MLKNVLCPHSLNIFDFQDIIVKTSYMKFIPRQFFMFSPDQHWPAKWWRHVGIPVVEGPYHWSDKRRACLIVSQRPKVVSRYHWLSPSLCFG